MIPIIARSCISTTEPEYAEMMKYESGDAELYANALPGNSSEPWINVLQTFEPASPIAINYLLNHSALSQIIRGSVIDLGAGTCWATALLSKHPYVTRVVAYDLSEHFLTTVGTRIINHYQGNQDIIHFAIGSYNQLPFANGTFDCAFLVASIHHSLSPLKTLLESRRVLTSNGTLVLIECPWPSFFIESGREQSIRLSRESGATEICYTRGELTYMLRHAGFENVKYYPIDDITRGKFRKVVRKVLRLCYLEDCIRPPAYVIVAKKQ